jgi:predicted permease
MLLCLSAFFLSLRLGGFPDITALHLSHWQAVPAGMVAWSMAETMRCADRTWSLHYASVLILLYTELMILALAVFLFFFP